MSKVGNPYFYPNLSNFANIQFPCEMFTKYLFVSDRQWRVAILMISPAISSWMLVHICTLRNITITRREYYPLFAELFTLTYCV